MRPVKKGLSRVGDFSLDLLGGTLSLYVFSIFFYKISALCNDTPLALINRVLPLLLLYWGFQFLYIATIYLLPSIRTCTVLGMPRGP